LSAFGERFLNHAALFPARFAGEPWGESRITIDLPGGPFAIRGISEEQRASLRDRFETRDGDSAETGLAYPLQMFRAAPSDFLPIDTRGWEYELELRGAAIAGMNLMARIEEDRGAIWTSIADRESFRGVVENVLRPLVARRLLASGGLLVHSAALVIGDRGLLFVGPSGAGKSTLAGMALDHGHGVLSDDLNAIAGSQLVPLPFTGDLPHDMRCRIPATLHAIIALEKGSSEHLRELSPAAAAALLIRSAPYVNVDATLSESLLARAHALVHEVRTAVLTFRRDGDVWPILASL
jgi:hypothetical protein